VRLLEALPLDGRGGRHDPAAGWLAGPDGPHHSEIVFPLLAEPAHQDDARAVHAPASRRQPAPRPGPPPRPGPAPRQRRELLPGGSWLFASVYSSAERHDELLAGWLPALLDRLPDAVDRWFFIRYRDPDPHLRLRFHTGSEHIGSTHSEGGHSDGDRPADPLLPVLHSWTEQLRDQGLTRRVVLDTYDPELERYGGPALIDAAERAFHADSLAVLDQLRLRETGGLDVDPALLAAADHVDLARRLLTAAAPRGTAPHGWRAALLSAYPRTEAHTAYQRRRAEANTIIDPDGDWAGLRARPGGERVIAGWARRAASVSAYGSALAAAGGASWAAPGEVLSALLHMHHNRAVGVDRQAERDTYALMRGALQAHADRQEHTR
jgi:thiopeptide-type bacteriocin biosynthesis protein